MPRRASGADASREPGEGESEPPSIATRRTGAGELPPREIARAGDGAVSEALAPARDGQEGGDASADGPVIQGIQGAPGAHSALGNTRGLSRPPHDKGEP